MCPAAGGTISMGLAPPDSETPISYPITPNLKSVLPLPLVLLPPRWERRVFRGEGGFYIILYNCCVILPFAERRKEAQNTVAT